MRRLWVLVLLSGCVARAPAPDLAVRIGSVGPLARLTPLITRSDTALLGPLVYDAFLTPAADGGWRSNVVERWEYDGARHLKIKLKEGLEFSDGSAVQPQDVTQSFASVGIKAQPREGWFWLESERSEDILDALLLYAVLHKSTPEGALGTGPFRVVSETPTIIRLERRQPIAGRVNVVELVAYADSRQAFGELLKGNANVLLTPDPGVLELVDGVSRLRVVRAPGLHAISVNFNAARVDVADRRRLVSGLDPVGLANAYGVNCKPLVRTSRARPAPEEGRPLKILAYDSDAASARAALALRRELGPRGGKLDVVPFVQFLERLRKGEFDVIVGPQQVWRAVVSASIWHSKSPGNVHQFADPAADAAFERRDYAAGIDVVEQDAATFRFCRLERVAIVDARFNNVTLGPYDMLESLPNWEVSQ